MVMCTLRGMPALLTSCSWNIVFILTVNWTRIKYTARKHETVCQVCWYLTANEHRRQEEKSISEPWMKLLSGGFFLTLRRLIVQEFLETWRENKSYIWKMFEPSYCELKGLLLIVPGYTPVIWKSITFRKRDFIHLVLRSWSSSWKMTQALQTFTWKCPCKVKFDSNSQPWSEQMRRRASGPVILGAVYQNKPSLRSGQPIDSPAKYNLFHHHKSVSDICTKAPFSPAQVRLFIHWWPDSLHDNPHYN